MGNGTRSESSSCCWLDGPSDIKLPTVPALEWLVVDGDIGGIEASAGICCLDVLPL